MTCEEFRELLCDHLCNELLTEVRERFEYHRSGCEHCGNFFESYSYTVKVTRQLPRCGPLPPSLEAKLRECLKNELGE
jgi:hypothetical protein